jgi:amylosucrase
MGEGFNYNPVNQDMRIVGTLASLAGLEQAITQGDKTLLRLAIERILMAYSVILSVGGIPLIYQGDEIATLNDQSYKLDPKKAADSRWIHRAAFDWQRAAQRHDPTTPQGEIYTRLLHMIQTRKATPTLGASATRFFESGSPHVLSYVRDGSLICLHNFSEHPITVPRTMLVAHAPIPATPYNLAKAAPVALEDALTLQPYDYVWLGATP